MKLSETQFTDFISWFSPRQAPKHPPTQATPQVTPQATPLPRSNSLSRKPVLSVAFPEPAPMMARARILPRASSKQRIASYVSVRSVGPSGIVLVDTGYWLDGEQFLLILPERSDRRRPARGVLCTVTRWAELNHQQFIISASFDRLVGAFEPGIEGKLQRTPRH